jgi:hypothetical protein
MSHKNTLLFHKKDSINKIFFASNCFILKNNDELINNLKNKIILRCEKIVHNNIESK